MIQLKKSGCLQGVMMMLNLDSDRKFLVTEISQRRSGRRRNADLRVSAEKATDRIRTNKSPKGKKNEQ